MESNTIRECFFKIISAPTKQFEPNLSRSFPVLKFGFAALLMLAISIAPAQAQQSVTVSGTVTDASDGQTLPGVNVTVQGTPARGTSTDTEGNYSLTVPSAQDTLVFSFIGYSSQQIPVQGRETIDVVLDVSVQQLEDVVVVGYGTQERQQITGSVSSVKAEDFVSGNVSNASELIQGKVPGLTISSAGGDPNSSPTIRLRGINTFSANQEPLVVVDGIIGASLDNIDPNDIASIDVLKDASAAAIYGTRGAGGVIIVTTKSGSNASDPSQAFTVNYSGAYTLEGIENKLDVLSADEYRQLSEETGVGINDLEGSSNYFDQITQRGMNNVQSLALAGGSEFTQYRISGNFRDRQGIAEGTGFERINGRINLTQSALDQKLDITFNMGVTNDQSDNGFGEAFRYAATMNPTAPIRSSGFDNTGGFTEISAFDIYNPVSIQETAKNESEQTLFTGALRASYNFRDLAPGLSIDGFYSLESDNYAERQFYSKRNKWRGGATQQSLGPGEARRYNREDRNQLFEATMNYRTDLEQLSLESVIGYSYSDFASENTDVSGGDFITDAVGFNNLGFAQDFTQGQGSVESFKSTNKIIGFFGRLNLNWDDTYFLNGSVRREGSSRFGENEKYGTFYALGGGIEVTSLVDLPVDRLKLRASYGVTGNNAPFDGISKLRFGPQGFFFVNGEFVQRFGPVSNANPDLKWEEKKELNFGLDFEAVSSRLNLTADYYIKTTDDLLYEIAVPVPPNLFPTTWQNIGELESRGFEAGINYDVFRGENLNWNTGFTFATNSSELTEFISEDEQFVSNAGSPGLNSTPLIRVKEGEPIGQIWGPEFVKFSEEEDGFTDDDGNPLIGAWLFRGANDSLKTPDLITREDEKVLGNGLPDFTLGWTNQFNYKNFDASVFLRGVFGHDMVNTYRLFYEPPSSISTWNVLQSAFDNTDLTATPNFSSYFVEDASFVRLQNATIGYTLPLKSAQISKLRIYLSANNLFTITDYKGVDPEVNYADPGPSDNGNVPGNLDDPDPLAPGIERRNGWFTTRSFTFGVQLDF